MIENCYVPCLSHPLLPAGSRQRCSRSRPGGLVLVPWQTQGASVAFIATATCSFATFASTGHISFAPLPFAGSAASGSHSLDLAASTIPGIITNVTAIAGQ